MTQPDYSSMKQAIVDGDVDRARSIAESLRDDGVDLLDAIENGFAAGIHRVGELWDEGEYFLPELVQGAEAMKAAMAVLEPALATHPSRKSGGVIVIGTVEGDLHDIGKSLVATLLIANGFEVHDLGANVSIDRFLEKALEVDAHIIAASALLTTTMEVQARLAEAMRASQRTRRLMVGGAPTTREWAEKLGALHGENAMKAVAAAKEIIQ